MTSLKSHESWIWMPHAGHLCVGHMCRFHLNTYVNGHIVSTVGEYWPDAEVRRMFVEHRGTFPRLYFDEVGKLVEKTPMTNEECQKLLKLKGDYFDDAYMKIFGYEDLGLNRKYETMVFPAEESENKCCLFAGSGEALELSGYNDPVEALQGHYEMCWQYHNASKLVKKAAEKDTSPK